VAKVTTNQVRLTFTNSECKIHLAEVILLSYNRYTDDDDEDGNNGGPVEGDDFERIDLEILGATVEAEYTIPNGGSRSLHYPKNLINEKEINWNKWL